MADDFKVQNYTQGIPYRGVNLSGAEFKDDGSGAARKGALAPTLQDAIPFIADGMNIFRIPITWEYLADTNGHINNDAYLQNVKSVVSDLSGHGAKIILDLHGYMRYNYADVSLDYIHTDKNGADVIGSNLPASKVSTTAYATLWGEIASSFSGANIMYELMNEPHDIDNALILQNYVAAIQNIRAVEGTQHHTILIDGNSWTGLHSWNDGAENSSKDLMSNLRKALSDDVWQNIAISVHQYFDPNSSGRYTDKDCMSVDTFKTQFDGYLPAFIDDLKELKVGAFLTEFNGVDTKNCQEILKYTLDAINTAAYTPENGYGFLGWTVWSAGGNWGDYILSIAPNGPAKGLENSVYKNYLTEDPGVITHDEVEVAKITNPSIQQATYTSGDVPAWYTGPFTLNKGDTMVLYKAPANNKQVQLGFKITGEDPPHYFGFGITALQPDGHAYGFSYSGNDTLISLQADKNCAFGLNKCWLIIDETHDEVEGAKITNLSSQQATYTSGDVPAWYTGPFTLNKGDTMFLYKAPTTNKQVQLGFKITGEDPPHYFGFGITAPDASGNVYGFDYPGGDALISLQADKNCAFGLNKCWLITDKSSALLGNTENFHEEL